MLLGGAATAADMAQRAPIIESASVAPEEIGTGWYLRGDIGFARQTPAKMTWQTTTETATKATSSLDSGIGLGYKFNDWMRADLTLDYLSKFKQTGTVSATASDVVRLDATTVMANGYADLGNYGGLTPYIGAGLGFAIMKASGAVRTTTTTSYAFSNANTYAFAASLATGVSYDLGHGVQTDLGYRMLYLSGNQTGTETTGTLVGPIKLSNALSHQFRIGLRYFTN